MSVRHGHKKCFHLISPVHNDKNGSALEGKQGNARWLRHALNACGCSFFVSIAHCAEKKKHCAAANACLHSCTRWRHCKRRQRTAQLARLCARICFEHIEFATVISQYTLAGSLRIHKLHHLDCTEMFYSYTHTHTHTDKKGTLKVLIWSQNTSISHTMFCMGVIQEYRKI